MDQLMSWLIDVLIGISRNSSKAPAAQNGISPGWPLKVLLVGYNGARNTGADARVHALVGQLKRRFGDAMDISVMTLSPHSTRRLFGPAKQIGFTEVFFAPLFKAVNEADAVILCEGSTLKSTFANALSLFFIQAAGMCKAQGKPCIAYGSEIGSMEPVLQKAAAKHCTDVLFIARSTGSLQRCQELGLTSQLGTDTAWDFESVDFAEEAEQILRGQGWDGKKRLIGVAPINPFWWPVRPSLSKLISYALGSKSARRYASMYFFTWDKDREKRFRDYLDAFAASVNKACADTDATPLIFGMERLDEEACHLLASKLDRPALTMLAADHDALVMAQALQRIDFLLTSRYHAQVLAMPKPVPTLSLSMDERLTYIAADMGLDGKLMVSVDDPHMTESLLEAWDYLRDHSEECVGLMQAYRLNCLDTLEQMLDTLDSSISQAYPHWKETRNANR